MSKEKQKYSLSTVFWEIHCLIDNTSGSEEEMVEG